MLRYLFLLIISFSLLTENVYAPPPILDDFSKLEPHVVRQKLKASGVKLALCGGADWLHSKFYKSMGFLYNQNIASHESVQSGLRFVTLGALKEFLSAGYEEYQIFRGARSTEGSKYTPGQEIVIGLCDLVSAGAIFGAHYCMPAFLIPVYANLGGQATTTGAVGFLLFRGSQHIYKGLPSYVADCDFSAAASSCWSWVRSKFPGGSKATAAPTKAAPPAVAGPAKATAPAPAARGSVSAANKKQR